MAKSKANKKQPGETGYLAKAQLNNVRVSPRKARLVVDMIRGKHVERALEILTVCEKKSAPLVRKLLLSAVANAQDRHEADADELFIKSAWVNEARTYHRFMPRARGSASAIRKRHSHITLLLDEAV